MVRRTRRVAFQLARSNRSPWFQRPCSTQDTGIWIIAAPWLGNLFGWIFTENGRQPWVVYGLLKTEDAVSDLSVGLVAASLAGFVILYAVIGVVEFVLMRRYAIRGPMDPDEPMPGEPPRIESEAGAK